MKTQVFLNIYSIFKKRIWGAPNFFMSSDLKLDIKTEIFESYEFSVWKHKKVEEQTIFTRVIALQLVITASYFVTACLGLQIFA